MKQRDLIRKLTAAGWKRLKDRDGDHYIYANPRSLGPQVMVQIPRHREIKEPTAKKILKDAGLK